MKEFERKSLLKEKLFEQNSYRRHEQINRTVRLRMNERKHVVCCRHNGIAVSNVRDLCSSMRFVCVNYKRGKFLSSHFVRENVCGRHLSIVFIIKICILVCVCVSSICVMLL